MEMEDNTKLTVILCIVVQILTLVTLGDTNEVVFGKALVPSRDFIWLHGLSYRECRKQCKARGSCRSLDYKRRTLSCRMNMFTADNDYHLVAVPGMVHDRLKDRPDGNEQFPCGLAMCTTDQTCDLHNERCLYTECRKLAKSSHGNTEGDMTYVGSKSMLNCDDTTYVIDSVVLPVQTKCQPNGNWSIDSRLLCFTFADICQTDLVSGPSGIKTKTITASSTYYPFDYHSPLNGILDGPDAWSARYNDDKQFLQVEFFGTKHVTGLVSQGRDNDPAMQQWVTAYGMAYSPDCVIFTDLTDSNNTIVSFAGNTDINTKVFHVLESPVEARCVRVKPTTWNSHISMRIGILGCEDADISNYRIIQRN